MRTMRRMRVFVLLTAVASLLVGPSAPPVEATPGSDFRLEAVVLGETLTPPPEDEDLFINRTIGQGRFDSPIQIQLVGECKEDDGSVEHFVALLASAHDVIFTSDDDVTDGRGRISPTDTDREFEDEDALEFREEDPDDAAPAEVRVRIVDGEFHRLLGVVEVELSLDIRVVRDPPGGPREQVCQTRDSDLVPFRIVFELLPNDDTTLTSSFFVVGVGRSHDPGDEPIVRPICDLIASQIPTRVSAINSPTPGDQPGHPFHPCRHNSDPG